MFFFQMKLLLFDWRRALNISINFINETIKVWKLYVLGQQLPITFYGDGRWSSRGLIHNERWGAWIWSYYHITSFTSNDYVITALVQDTSFFLLFQYYTFAIYSVGPSNFQVKRGRWTKLAWLIATVWLLDNK